MFEDIRNEMIEKCCKEIIDYPSKSLQNVLNKLKGEVSLEDFEKGIKSIVQFTMGQSLIMKLDEKEIEKVFIESTRNLLKQLPTLKKSFVLSIELEGLEKEVNRVMEVPSSMNLADLCYAILAVFESQGSHLFQIKHNKIKYECDVSEDDGYFEEEFIYASMVDLPELNLRKGSKLELWYDFGDNYNFKIKVIEVKDNQNILDLNDIKVLSGCGYGIWEDAHYELSLYYRDYQEFIKSLEENGIEEEWYPSKEVFDLDYLNRNFLDRFFMICAAYRYDENLC